MFWYYYGIIVQTNLFSGSLMVELQASTLFWPEPTPTRSAPRAKLSQDSSLTVTHPELPLAGDIIFNNFTSISIQWYLDRSSLHWSFSNFFVFFVPLEHIPTKPAHSSYVIIMLHNGLPCSLDIYAFP